MTKTSRIKPWSAAIIVTVFCVAVTGASAITTKTSGTAVIKTKLQLIPQAVGETTKDDDQPSFAARYWEHQQDTSNGPRPAYDEYDSLQQQQPPHKLSAAQQTQILDDIRRHNQQQQQPQQPLWTERSPTVKARQTNNGADSHSQPESAADQLQELLQINGVVDEPATDDNPDDDRQGKQRSIGFGGGSGGWQPQPVPPQMYNNQNRQQVQPSLSPFVPPPPAAISPPQQNVQPPPPQQQQPQYYPTSTSATGPAVQQYPQQQRHQQQQQLFVTTPSSSASTTAAANNNNYNSHYHRQHNQQQQYAVPQQYYPQLPTKPSSIGSGDPAGGEIDADIEQQIRQQLTAVVGSGGGNYTILTSLNGGASKIGSISDDSRSQLQSIASSASNDNMQYTHIGSPSSPRNRVSQQQPQLETGPTVGTSVGGHKNTIVKTVVIRQKPSPARQAAAAVQTTAASPVVTAASQQHQHTWTMSEQQQLEQLARQVLPPGVAQYEIIRAGGVDGSGAKGGGDVAAAATVSADSALPVGSGGVQQSVPPPAGGKKKPVTFVILEERPDGTVRVRGVEKKQHGTGPTDGGGGTSATDSGSAASADDEQLQQLVDKLNRGELRLPSAGLPKTVGGTDSVNSASTTAAVPIPAFAPSPSSPPLSNNGKHKHKPYNPTATQQSTTTITTELQHTQFQNNYFLPTVPTVPTAAVPVATTTNSGIVPKKDNQHRYHHKQQQQQQQQHQYYSTPAITTSASSTPLPANSTMSYYNDSPTNNNHNNKNKAPKDGTFSSALRRRGYYAMAKYMRQAGIDTVLEDTGPFTVFVPTDKAFRALLVQLGGPDRAEDKFRENPRLLIGLLLHHVVPGAFKVADLKAGDEMTGVSLAGTQLRANLYARQLYDNRWNDIEVLTINGARVLDDVVPEALSGADDSPSYDDNANGPVQQRRDMVLSSGGGAGGERGNQQIIAIGHAVDRVLFPLPVGDILATMRADRQRRYNVFLRAVDEYCSPSVRALLTGSRTVTVFAPVDDAFRVRRGSGNFSSSGSIVDGLLRDDGGGRSGKRYRRRIADRFVLSHVVLAGPGDPPMYTAGLRFYQVRDTAYRVPDENSAAVEDDEESAADGNDGNDGNLTLPPADGENVRYYQLTVYKDSGRIRLNGGAAQVLVRNVPATNGVLHGLDAPLV